MVTVIGALLHAWVDLGVGTADEAEDATTAYMHALNATYLRRAGFLARTGGNVLVVVGVIGAVAWLWLAFRQQMEGGSFLALSSDFGDGSASIGQRLDSLAGTFSLLVSAAVAVAVGLAVRLLAANSSPSTAPC